MAAGTQEPKLAQSGSCPSPLAADLRRLRFMTAWQCTLSATLAGEFQRSPRGKA